MKHNIVLLASHSRESAAKEKQYHAAAHALCLLYTSDAADE